MLSKDFKAYDTQPVTNDEVKSCAYALSGADANALWAVIDVESGGHGFTSDKKPVARFEAHIFSDKTHHRFDQTYPDLSGPYGGSYRSDWSAIEDALALDEQATLLSCSWGMMQVMGFNHAMVGFHTPDSMVDYCLINGEVAHLDLGCRFMVAAGLGNALAAHDWETVARIYNGSANVPVYSQKLADAYAKRAAGYTTSSSGSHPPGARTLKQGMNGDDVLAMQSALNKSGCVTLLLAEDGAFGTGTGDAVGEFQRRNKLASDEVCGTNTWNALKPWL